MTSTPEEEQQLFELAAISPPCCDAIPPGEGHCKNDAVFFATGHCVAGANHYNAQYYVCEKCALNLLVIVCKTHHLSGIISAIKL